MSAEESDRDVLNQALIRLAFLERCDGVTNARLSALEAHHTDDIPPFIRAAVPEDALPSGERTTKRRGLPPDFLKPGGIQWVDNLDDMQAARLVRAVLGTSPLEREILTHYYTSPTEFRGNWQEWGSTVRGMIERFVDLGLLLRVAESTPGPTIRGNDKALGPYMEALANVPLPVQRWVAPEV